MEPRGTGDKHFKPTNDEYKKANFNAFKSNTAKRSLFSILRVSLSGFFFYVLIILCPFELSSALEHTNLAHRSR